MIKYLILSFLIFIFVFLSVYIKPYTESLKKKEDNLLKIKAMDNIVLTGFKEKFGQIGISLLNMEMTSEQIYGLSGHVQEREHSNLEALFQSKSRGWIQSIFERK